MIEITFAKKHRPYKTGEYKLVQQEYFHQWIWLVKRTWYGWRSVCSFTSWKAAEIEMESRKKYGA